jgi:hypothetical protein
MEENVIFELTNTIIDAWVMANMFYETDTEDTENIVTKRIQSHFSNNEITNLNVNVKDNCSWRVTFTIEEKNFEFQSPDYNV